MPTLNKEWLKGKILSVQLFGSLKFTLPPLFHCLRKRKARWRHEPAGSKKLQQKLSYTENQTHINAVGNNKEFSNKQGISFFWEFLARKQINEQTNK